MLGLTTRRPKHAPLTPEQRRKQRGPYVIVQSRPGEEPEQYVTRYMTFADAEQVFTRVLGAAEGAFGPDRELRLTLRSLADHDRDEARRLTAQYALEAE
jgi:hypothetical protein